MTKIIERDLTQLLNPNENILSGRDQGEQSRGPHHLNLDSLDVDKNIQAIHLILKLPIISITPSFYLGLLFKSYKKLGYENFHSRYSLTLEFDNLDLLNSIKRDIKDGDRAALDALNPQSFMSKLLNNKNK